jgi:hypothetical protein
MTFDPATRAGSAGAPIFSWTESGYLLEGSGFVLHTDSNTPDSLYPDNGTAYIRTTYNGPKLTLSSVDGSLFNLVSLDFAEFSSPSAYYSPQVTIIGHRADGVDISAVMEADRIIDGHGILNDFETILFSGFENLVSLELPGVAGYSLDNIVIESVPEPATVGLFLIGLAGLYAQRKVSK